MQEGSQWLLLNVCGGTGKYWLQSRLKQFVCVVSTASKSRPENRLFYSNCFFDIKQTVCCNRFVSSVPGVGQIEYLLQENGHT